LHWAINLVSDIREVSLKQYSEKTHFRPIKNGIPDKIFELIYPESSDNFFCKLAKEHGSTLGYHGSALENLYSIINSGFSMKYAKEESIYGRGIYFAEDYNVARTFLKYGKVTPFKSNLGNDMACLLGCEILKHTDVKRYQDDSNDTKVRMGTNSDLPTYLVVNNEKYIKVKYILVFKKAKTPTNKMFIFGCIYVAILLFVGFLQSNYWRRFKYYVGLNK